MKITIIALLLHAALATAERSSHDKIQYLFPGNGTSWINQKSPVIVRFNDIGPDQLADRENFINAYGDKSGKIKGKTIISSDRRTIIFKPETPYYPEETVSINLSPRLIGESESFLDTTVTFTVATANSCVLSESGDDNSEYSIEQKSVSKYTPNKDGVVVLNGVSVPSDFPYIDITINDNPDTGYIFCNYEGDRFFNLILDNSGAPVFYWIVPDSRRDFKVQETGVLTMTVRQGFGGGGYIAVDNTYAVVDTFFAPAGYTIDEHELLVLPNGHYLVTAMDTRSIDMSKIVTGGNPRAVVTGYHLIEMDGKNNPVLIWRCWDNYDITDAEYVDLTQKNIDYLHTNSIAVDLDGNYLISPKLLNEITKINRHTGEIMWRLGGKKNQFEYVNFDDFIYMQHSIRVLPNGNYTVFDNGNYHTPHYSRALEFKVDPVNMTATKIWEFRDTPDKKSEYKGNVQRLPNGNTLINWGMQYLPKLTEVRPDGSKAFEMNFAHPVQSYRVFRFPWKANAAAPFLVVEYLPDKVALLFNKFGDPDVKEYRVYGSPTEHPESLVRTTSQPYIILDENDFTESNTYHFRVTAMDSHGNESGFSNEERVTTTFTPVDKNLIDNGDFTNGSSHWDFHLFGSASARLNTSNDACTIEIEEGGSQLSDIMLSQENLALYQDQTYSFEFDAWADEVRAIDAKIESAALPYTNYGQIGLSLLKQTRNRFVYTFTMENSTTHQARLVFYIGQGNKDVHIDNVDFMRTYPSEAVLDPSGQNPSDIVLFPVYPNPFNSNTTISFSLPAESFVNIEIFDILGRITDSLSGERLRPGHHIRHFGAEHISSGVYFCRLTAEEISSGKRFYRIRKMVKLN